MSNVLRWTGRETRLLRQALRLSVRAFADDLGVSPRAISKWESRGATLEPRPDLQAALDTMVLRAGAEERARFAVSLASDAVGPMTGGTSLAEAAEESVAFAVWWGQSASGAESVHILHAELQRVARDYLSGAPEPVVRSAISLRGSLFSLLRSPQTPSASSDLHLMAGYTCVLLGWFSGDLGQLPAAGTHAATASLFAEISGSPELAAWVQAVRSKTAFWCGDYGLAAEEASRGLETAPASSVRVLLAAQAADAWASLGDLASARSALGDVAEAREAESAPEFVSGLLSFSHVREVNYVSGIYQVLGEHERAIDLADEALRLSVDLPVRSYATEAQIRLNQVDAFLDAGDLDGARSAIAPVLALPIERRLSTLTARVGRYSKPLAEERFARQPRARALREDVATFAESTLGRTG